MTFKPSYSELERRYIDALNNADALYKSFFENCHAVMLIVCPETGAIVDANDAACDYYGFPKARLVEMTIMQINTLPPRALAQLMRQTSENKQNYFNFQHRVANGEIRDVEVYSGPIVYKGAQVLYSIIHDISERKQLQEQIVREKQFSESLVSSLPGVMYMFDEEGAFLRWNRNFEKVTGFSEDEIKRMRPVDFIAPNDKDSVTKSIQKVYQKGEASVEACLITKTDRAIPYFLTGVRFVMKGRPHLVGVGIDIAERVRTENEKQILIEQLQAALSQVKKLSGFLPICSACKKIRDDKGYWNQIEAYIRDHSEAEFSHSICPECAGKLYPSMR